MHTSDLIKGFPLLAKVPVLNVDPGALVPEKELLQTIEQSLDLFFCGAVHLSELFHENGVEFLSGVLAEGQGG